MCPQCIRSRTEWPPDGPPISPLPARLPCRGFPGRRQSALAGRADLPGRQRNRLRKQSACRSPLTTDVGREAARVLDPRPCRRLARRLANCRPKPAGRWRAHSPQPINSTTLRPKIIRHIDVLKRYRTECGRVVGCRLHGWAVEGTLNVSPQHPNHSARTTDASSPIDREDAIKAATCSNRPITNGNKEFHQVTPTS
jgi:hypothetical protein